MPKAYDGVFLLKQLADFIDICQSMLPILP